MMEKTSRLELIKFEIEIRGKEWDLIKPTVKYDKDRIDMRLNDPWVHIINQKIWETRQLPCAFTLKKQQFYKRTGFPYFAFHGHCNDKQCYQDIKGECLEPGTDGVIIQIVCYNTLGISHKKNWLCEVKLEMKRKNNWKLRSLFI